VQRKRAEGYRKVQSAGRECRRVQGVKNVQTVQKCREECRKCRQALSFHRKILRDGNRGSALKPTVWTVSHEA